MSAHADGLDKTNQLASSEALDEVFDHSSQRPQLVFKHSLTCPISARAHRHYLSYLNSEPADGVDHHLVIVQNARPVSNEIASRTSVRHESPQALLLVNGSVVWNASHGGITEDSLRQAITDGTS